MNLISVLYFDPIYKKWRSATISDTSDVAKAIRGEHQGESRFDFLRSIYKEK